MNTKIVTPGEKIKELRKRYNVKQQELTGDKITRNMLSMIETDRAGLTESTANIIIENLTRICNEKKINLDISLEYLTESSEKQGLKIANEFIALLDINPKIIFEKDHEKDIIEVENIIEKYKLKNEKFVIYEKLGNIYKDHCDYYRAYTFYLKAFESCQDLFNNIKLIHLISKIASCCGNMNRFEEGIDFIRLASIYMTNIPDDLLYIFKYNNIIFLKKLDKFDECLAEIEAFEKYYNTLSYDKIKTYYIQMVKANCLKCKKFYSEALDTHNNILKTYKNDVEVQLVTLCNITEIYRELNDTKGVKKYLDKSLMFLNEYKKLEKKVFSPNIYHELALSYYSINELTMSKLYFEDALKESKKSSSKVFFRSCLKNILDISITLKDSDEIFKAKNQLLELTSLGLIEANDIVVFDFIDYFNSIGDIDAISDIVKFIKKNTNDHISI